MEIASYKKVSNLLKNKQNITLIWNSNLAYKKRERKQLANKTSKNTSIVFSFVLIHTYFFIKYSISEAKL